MRLLEASGVDVVKSRERLNFGLARSSGGYQANPGGELYEPSPKDMQEIGFPRRFDGMALKVVTFWLPALSVHDYRVVFMRRHPLAIHDSLERFANRDLPKLSVTDIQRSVVEGLLGLRNRKDVRDVIEIDSDELVSDPLNVICSLRSEGWPLLESSAECVDPSYARAG